MSPKFYLYKPLCLLFLSFSLVACVPSIPTPEGEASVAATGETQNLYLPSIQSKGEPFPMPNEAPLTAWFLAERAVPIMPGALVGQEMGGKYVFTTSTSILDVKNYYLQELEAQGWEVLSIGEGPNHTVLLFQQGEARVTITMDFLVEPALCYVVIAGE